MLHYNLCAMECMCVVWFTFFERFGWFFFFGKFIFTDNIQTAYGKVCVLFCLCMRVLKTFFAFCSWYVCDSNEYGRQERMIWRKQSQEGQIYCLLGFYLFFGISELEHSEYFLYVGTGWHRVEILAFFSCKLTIRKKATKPSK